MDEHELFRQRWHDRNLEEARRVRMDDRGSIGGEEGSNLPLSAGSDGIHISEETQVKPTVRVSSHCWVLGEGQIVSIIRCNVGEVSRAEDRRHRRIGAGLIRFRELNDDRLGRNTWQRPLPKMQGVGHGIGGLVDPSLVLKHLLDLDRASNVVDNGWLISERHVFIKKWRLKRNPAGFTYTRRGAWGGGLSLVPV